MGNKVSAAYKRHSDAKSGHKKKPVSPVPSHPSSLTSQESNSNASDIIRHGRKFHNFSESTYWLPNDEEEMDRLVGQHFALKELFGGNILKEAHDYMKFDKPVRILDIGCGPGTWIMDVATEFPDCEFVGIDMCPVFPTNIRPPNVTFQHGNVLEGLPFEDESFDFINLRFFMLALKRDQWAIVMKEIYRLLKPGGCLQSLESGMMDRGNEFVLWVGEVFKNVMQDRGQEPYIAFKLANIMREAKFEIIKVDQRDTYLGQKDPLNREFLWDICNIVKSVQPFLAGPLGVAPENYPKFLQKFCIELQKNPQGQWMIVMTLARKP